MIFLLKIVFEKVEAFADKLLSNSVARCNDGLQFEDILCEEFENYFAGKITKEMLSEYLTKRTELYISETETSFEPIW